MRQNLLLDTHVLLWWLGEPARLQPQILEMIEDPHLDIFYSVASV